MHFLFRQFLGQNHSWSVVGQNLARAFLSLNHQTDLISTNGVLHFPQDLKQHLTNSPKSSYDAQISYTAPLNFPQYLSSGKKNRFAIWNYETTVIPPYLIKFFSYPDFILPSSNFSKQIFLENKVPENKLVTVPHGIDFDYLNSATPYQLKTKKSFKILSNIAQPHFRKNITGLLESYGKAFANKDDVCLILKISIKEKSLLTHDVSFPQIFYNFKKKFPQHAEIEIISDFVTNIGSLYKVCDIVFSIPHAECFWLPGLEAAALGKASVVSNYGGQLDFLNSSNSFLIDGSIVQAPPQAQYWYGNIGSSNPPSAKAKMFSPNIDHAVDTLRALYGDRNLYTSKSESLIKLAQSLTWTKAAQQILSLTS